MLILTSRADTEHFDVKPSLKSDEEPLQDQQPRPEKETKQNDEAKLSNLLSESEAKPEAGSASDSTESKPLPKPPWKTLTMTTPFQLQRQPYLEMQVNQKDPHC